MWSLLNLCFGIYNNDIFNLLVGVNENQTWLLSLKKIAWSRNGRGEFGKASSGANALKYEVYLKYPKADLRSRSIK